MPWPPSSATLRSLAKARQKDQQCDPGSSEPISTTRLAPFYSAIRHPIPRHLHLPASSSYLIAVGQLAEHVRQQVTGDGSTHEWSKLGASCLALLDFAEDELPSLYQEAEDILKTVD